MDYLIAILAGCAYGTAAGALKYLFLWRPFINERRKFTNRNIMVSQTISIIVSVIVLLSVFFLRHLWPYSFELTILGSAIGLSIMSRLSPLRDIKKLETAANTEKNENKVQDVEKNG